MDSTDSGYRRVRVRASQIFKTRESWVAGRSVREVSNLNDADLVPTAIEDMKTGMTLAVERDGVRASSRCTG
jgi:hypothetical protein